MRLFPWWPARNPALETLDVVLFTRQGCHLCEDAWRLLEAAQQRWGFRLVATDVDESAEMVERFGECVPVVTVAGTVRFRGIVNPVLLERLLRAEADARRRKG